MQKLGEVGENGGSGGKEEEIKNQPAKNNPKKLKLPIDKCYTT